MKKLFLIFYLTKYNLNADAIHPVDQGEERVLKTCGLQSLSRKHICFLFVDPCPKKVHYASWGRLLFHNKELIRYMYDAGTRHTTLPLYLPIDHQTL